MEGTSESFFKKITYTEGIYPLLRVEDIKNPSKLFAVPLVGILIKFILLIPVFIELIFLFIWLFITVMLINPMVVLFSGKYWPHAHQFSVVLLRLSTKVICYIYGLTDKYPGFDFKNLDGLELEMPLNITPNKLFAIPILGGLARIILLFPYYVFVEIISSAAMIGTFILAWAVVLFSGKFPEGIFELVRDSIRANNSSAAYLMGLSDKYPSFYISMAHDKIKLILIAIAIILSGWNYSSNSDHSNFQNNSQDYHHKQQLFPNLRTN